MPLLVHGDGFCRNNEKQNKTAKTAVRQLLSTQGKGTLGVLTAIYTYATLHTSRRNYRP